MKDKDMLNRMLTKGKNQCFITLKEHKPNFKNNKKDPKVRLINCAKNEVGQIGKNIFNKINYKQRGSLRINQWKDTSEFIGSFLKTADENRYKFAICNVKDSIRLYQKNY